MTRCLVVDDSPAFREAVCALLAADGVEIVGTATTGSQALDRVRELRPTVVLLDVDLGPEDGFEVARRLADEPAAVRPRVVMVSTRDEDAYAERLAVAPVVGFLTKETLAGDTLERLLLRAR